jgi:hypothetical protein
MPHNQPNTWVKNHLPLKIDVPPPKDPHPKINVDPVGTIGHHVVHYI